MGRAERIVVGLETVFGVAGRVTAWTCVALVLLVAGDAFARYFFRTGAVWLKELQWHLISPIALFGMSCVLLSGEQVRVDVLYERLPAAVHRGIEMLTGLALVFLSPGLATLLPRAIGW